MRQLLQVRREHNVGQLLAQIVLAGGQRVRIDDARRVMHGIDVAYARGVGKLRHERLVLFERTLPAHGAKQCVRLRDHRIRVGCDRDVPCLLLRARRGHGHVHGVGLAAFEGLVFDFQARADAVAVGGAAVLFYVFYEFVGARAVVDVRLLIELTRRDLRQHFDQRPAKGAQIPFFALHVEKVHHALLFEGIELLLGKVLYALFAQLERGFSVVGITAKPPVQAQLFGFQTLTHHGGEPCVPKEQVDKLAQRVEIAVHLSALQVLGEVEYLGFVIERHGRTSFRVWDFGGMDFLGWDVFRKARGIAYFS